MLRVLFVKEANAASGIYKRLNFKALQPAVFQLTTQRDVEIEVEEANKEFTSFFGSQLEHHEPLESGRNSTRQHFSKQLKENILTHVDSSGSAQMVDISQKSESFREASASARVCLSPEAFLQVKENRLKKGDVLSVSKVAGIVGAKYTSFLLPLCHNINLNHVDVSFSFDKSSHSVLIVTRVSCFSSTGVEMEALMSAAIASLNVIDMVKAVNKDASITDLRLDSKKGGKSGVYIRNTSDKAL